jgi:hypothetical protein
LFFLLKKERMSDSRNDLGYWTLPLPDIEGKEWSRIPRVSRHIPFGYVVDSEDDDYLIPVPEELEALEMAKKHLKQYSYRKVANWLTQQTGRSISFRGLKKRIDIENKRRKVTGIKRQLAKRLEKTLHQIKKLEEGTGTYTTEDRTT